MYSKNAKYKQVLNCYELPAHVEEIIQKFCIAEGYTELVKADFYFHPAQGLVVVIDGRAPILQWYKNYKMLNCAAFPISSIGQLVYSIQS